MGSPASKATAAGLVVPSLVLSFHSYLWPPDPLGALWPCCFVPARSVPPLWWPPTRASRGLGTFLWPFDAFVGLTSAAGIAAARDDAVVAQDFWWQPEPGSGRASRPLQ